MAISAVRRYPPKKIQFLFYFSKKRKKKTKKSWRPTRKMCLSGINLDVLTLELDMKVQFANF
jgi:hypothetical protein